jgi:hypothetical protein
MINKLDISPGDLISIQQFRALNVNIDGDRTHELNIFEQPIMNRVGYTHWGNDRHVLFLVEKTPYKYNDFFTPVLKHFYHEHEIWKVISREKTYWALFLVREHEDIIKLNVK